MRRVLVIVIATLAIGTAAVTAGGAGGGDAGATFTVELDNAFGLVEGADVKVAGVRAGRIDDMRVDTRTRHALVDVTIERPGFGSLRADVTCETRPQSLIGEYFIDCDPGRSEERLPSGSTIPIERTTTTIAPDLVNSIMRRPYAERLRIILSELGVGLSARGDALNAAIRRASPALRETNRVLAILARQNRTLRDLVTDADTVLADLAGNRRDVSRWVREAGNTAAVSADRRREIRESLARLPGFLRELEPTMAELGRAADAHAPALADLRASAGGLENLLTSLAPFTDATRVNLRSLGRAARDGRPALRAAAPVVDELRRFSADTPELAKNLRIVLDDLDDRDRAVEEDPRSPGGKGYTGFEALLQYVYDQSLSINIFDAHGYMLKANLFVSECSEYQNAETLAEHMQEDPGFYERCASILGPNQLGVLQPDPTKSHDARRGARRERRAPEPRRRRAAAPAPPSAEAPAGESPAPQRPSEPQELIQEALEKLLDGRLGELPGLDGLDRTPGPAAPDLLDFLLAP